MVKMRTCSGVVGEDGRRTDGAGRADRKCLKRTRSKLSRYPFSTRSASDQVRRQRHQQVSFVCEAASPAHPTTINRQDLAINVHTSTTRQVDNRTLEVVGRTPSASWNPLQDTPRPILIVDQSSIHLRGDIARSYAIDVDAFTRPLVTHGLRKLSHPAFAGCISRDIQAALEALEGADIDDTATFAVLVLLLGEHVRADVPAQSEDCRKVDLQYFGPVIVRELVSRVPSLNPAAVQQDVYAMTIGQHFGDQLLDRLMGCQVRDVDL